MKEMDGRDRDILRNGTQGLLGSPVVETWPSKCRGVGQAERSTDSPGALPAVAGTGLGL